MPQGPAFKLRELSLRIALCTGAASVAVLGPALPAAANPAGADVVHGSASFMQDGGLLQIDNSPGAIINWSTFSIASDEITRFQQQSAQSAVLNRVTGGEISEIFGQLQSNGHVFLINPNGMVFGQNATIDTAGFVASTLDIANEDFLAGDYRFAGDSGRIINEGYLTTRSGNVYFLAPDIENAGIIHAESGALILAAGRSIRIGSLDAPDIQFEITAPDDTVINLGELLAEQGSVHAFADTLTHSGVISASAAALAEDGSVVLYAEDDIDLQAGSTISASGASGGDIRVQSRAGTVLSAGTILAEGDSGDGGRIRLLGDRVGVLGEARISAEGSSQGGEILIGGNLSGLGPEPNAEAVFIGTDASVSASSTDSGAGGTIIAYADELNRSYGKLTARGGPNGGDGGFIETSAGFIEVTRTPDAGASNGRPGQWLIDPDLLVIGEAGLVEVVEQNQEIDILFSVEPSAVAPTIQNTVIEDAINGNPEVGGTSVTVATNGNANNILIESPLNFNATTSFLSLTFDTTGSLDGNIFVNAAIINEGSASLDYLFQTEGFIDFGADVDTGGLLGGNISAASSYGGYGGYGGFGGDAIFSGDVRLRGNLDFSSGTIDGPFLVEFDSDFVNLTSLTLQGGADLVVAGDLSVGDFGFGSLSAAESTLSVGGMANLDDVTASASSLDFQGGIFAGLVDIDGTTMDLGGSSSSIETLLLSGSDLQLNDAQLLVDVLELDGSITANGSFSSFLDVTSSFAWQSGTLGSLGESLDVSIGSAALASIESSAPKTMEGPTRLSVFGNLEWTDGDVTMLDEGGEVASQIEILGGGTFDIDLLTPRTLGTGSGESRLIVAEEALLSYFAGSADANIDVLAFIDGTATIAGDDLFFSRGGVHTGILQTDEGGRVSFGTVGEAMHTISGDVVGAGTIRFTETAAGFNRVTNTAIYQPFETIVEAGRVDFEGPATLERLMLSGGAIGGPGDVSVIDRMDWTGGRVGTANGGALFITSDALLDISGPNDKIITGMALLENSGVVNWRAGDIVMSNTASLVNLGILSTTGLDGSRSILRDGGTPTFFNDAEALLDLTSDGVTLPIDIEVDSVIEGDVTVDNVEVTFNGGGAHNASYLIDTGKVEFAGTEVHFWEQGLDFSGNGFVEVSSGSVVVDAEIVDLDNLRFSGGTIAGFGGLFVSDSMDWSGGTLGGPESFGSLEIGVEATLDIDSSSAVGLTDYLLTNFGQANWLDGDINFMGDARVENSGTFNAILAEGPQAFVQLGGGSNTLANNGQFIVDAGAAEFSSSVFILNFGSMQIENGLTRLLADSASDEGGSWSIEGGQLRLEGGSHFAGRGTSFSGDGTLQLSSGATLFADGDVFIDNLLLDDGVVEVSGETQVLDSFIWNAGSIAFPKGGGEQGIPLDGGGAVQEIGGGDLQGIGGGSLVTVGADVLLTTAGLKRVSGAGLAFDTASSVVWDGGDIELVNAGFIGLLGDLAIRTDTDITSPDQTGFFHSEGTITKDSTDGTTRFLAGFENDGSMTALTGTISLERGATHEGDFLVQAPAGLAFVGDHVLLGDLDNAGTQSFADATMTIDGPFSANEVILDDFSSITFNGSYTADATSIRNDSVAIFPFAASTGDLVIAQNSGVEGAGALTVTAAATIDDLLLTRSGDTIFSDSSTLMAGAIGVSGPGTLTLNGSATVADLSIEGGDVSVGGDLLSTNLLIDGGTLTGPGNTEVGGVLELVNGGVIDGAGHVSVAGTFEWVDGLLAGSGVLDIAPGGSLLAAAPEGREEEVPPSLTVQDRTLLNRSEVGIDLLGVGLALDGSAVLDNRGRMRVEATPENALLRFTGTGTIVNAGSFETTGSEGGPALVEVTNRFDNAGTVTLSSGILRLFGGGTHSGSFLMAGPIGDSLSGRLRFGGTHMLDGDSSLAGAEVGVSFGSTTIGGAVDLDSLFVADGSVDEPGHLILDSNAELAFFRLLDLDPTDDLMPTLTGSGDIDVSTQFVWDSGIIGGNGRLVIADTAETAAFGLDGSEQADAPIPLLTLSGRTLSNAAADAHLDRGRLEIVDGGVLENSGGFTLASMNGGPFTIEGGSAGTFRNTGTFSSTAGLILGTTTENAGTLQALNLDLAAGVMLTQSGGSITTPGDFDVRGALTQEAGTLSVGSIALPEGSSAVLMGTLNADVAAISGGSLAIDGSADLDDLALSMGAVGGSGTINVANRIDWLGGVISGGGTINLASGSSGIIGGAGRVLTGYTLNQGGSLDLEGDLTLDGGATLRNTGTLAVAGAEGAGVTISGTAADSLDNSGDLLASTPLTLALPTITGGNLSAPSLTLASGTPMSIIGGSTTVADTFAVGGDLRLLGGSLAAETINVTGSLAGIGTVTGNLNNSGLLSPGTSPGALGIDGNFAQDALGTLRIEVDGDASQPGVDFDLLAISGSASFDGTLEFIALEGFASTFGTSFQPITYASATGSFAQIVQPGTGVQFTPFFGPNGLTAEVTGLLNPDGTANIDPDDPPIPADREQAELFADAVLRSRDRTQEGIETTNTTVTLSNEQQEVEDECAERLDEPDADGDGTSQGVGCRSI